MSPLMGSIAALSVAQIWAKYRITGFWQLPKYLQSIRVSFQLLHIMFLETDGEMKTKDSEGFNTRLQSSAKMLEKYGGLA